MILAVCAFTHVNARLLLVGQALPEEVAAAGILQGVIGFDGEEFSDALSDALSPRNAVKVCAGVAGLFFNPSTGARGILVLKPAIRVRDGNPM
jgi:hypothetical protein